MNDYHELISMLTFACLAAMGGLVRVLAKDEKYTMVRFFSGAVVGVFCGLMAAFGCKHFGVGNYATSALTGMCGYVGTPLLDIVGGKLKKFVESKGPTEDKKEK